MLQRIIKLVFICLVLFSSCKSKKKVTYNKRTPPKTQKVVKKQAEVKITTTDKVVVEKQPTAKMSHSEAVFLYIENYHEIAKEEMRLYSIPASITLAQGILESGAGRGNLSSRSNNHFGIKCHKSWEGERVYHDDDELQECFRKYEHPNHSFRDHSLFLSKRSRYESLFKHELDDYKSWAKGLRKAGYATDPKYPQKLISIIEKYELYEHDEDVLGKKSKRSKRTSKKEEINKEVKTYTVEKGDTLYSISRRFSISVASLKKYNGLVSNNIAIGQKLYLHLIKD